MKTTIRFGWLMIISMALINTLHAAAMDATDKLSYTLGYQMGSGLKSQQITLNPAIVTQGLQDAISGKPPILSAEEQQKTMNAMQQKMMQKMKQQMQEQATKNEKIGADFLAANAKKPGVKTTESGLQYKVITAGTGPMPAKTDTVNVEYEGRLIDGTVFDSSAQHGGKASFRVSDVILGWSEALQMMKTGSSWELFIPAKLAYGKTGVPGAIPPNATLIFKVTLVSIQK